MMLPTRLCLFGVAVLLAKQSYAVGACSVEGVSLASATEVTAGKPALVVHLATTGLDPVLIQRPDGTQTSLYPMREYRAALARPDGFAANPKPHFVLTEGETAQAPAASLGPPLPPSQAKQRHTCEMSATRFPEGFGLDVWERYCTQNPHPHRLHDCLWGSSRNNYLPTAARQPPP